MITIQELKSVRNAFTQNSFKMSRLKIKGKITAFLKKIGFLNEYFVFILL